MRAVNYYIVVENIKLEDKTIAGLIVKDENNRYNKGKVITIGNLVQGVCDNDIVHYDKHAGHAINWQDNEYQVITVKDVVLVE
jgi:co-chaperonin GroES (HSP10)|tara:strand:- start:567 stop:815 length:249 start_codon:yes stop_codon:yes gene_type:complete